MATERSIRQRERLQLRRAIEQHSQQPWPTVTVLPRIPDLSEGHCRGAGDLFYPEGPGRRDVVDAALRVCQGCPLRQPCLDYALAAKERHGIWGGVDMDRAARIEARLADASADTNTSPHRPPAQETPVTETAPADTAPPTLAAAPTDQEELAMTDTTPAQTAADAARTPLVEPEKPSLTAADGLRIGFRAGELIAEAYQTDVSGRVLELILTELVERQDLELLARLFDVLDDVERERDAVQEADAQRAERARQEAARALLVPCETCGATTGQPCLNKAQKITQPHKARLRAGHSGA